MASLVVVPIKTSRQRFFALLIFTLLATWLPADSYAREYNYVHYTTKDGLAGETVHGIAQDKDGFIWFATETGISRFDGKQFKNFSMEDGLPSSEIFGFYEDSKGRLWLHPFKNAICYYYKGKIHNQVNDPLLRKIKLTSPLKKYAETRQGDILVWDWDGNEISISQEGLVRYQKYTDTLYRNYTYRDFVRPATITIGLLADTVRSLVRKHIGYPLHIGDLIIKDADTYTLGLVDEFVIVDPQHEICYRHYCPSLQFARVAGKGHVWYSTVSGSATLLDYIHNITLGVYLPQYVIHVVFTDREGNTWFSTRGNGVFKLGLPNVVVYSNDDRKALNVVESFLEKEGILYAADDNGGLWRLGNVKAADTGGFPEEGIRKIKVDISWLGGKLNCRYIYCGSSDFFCVEQSPRSGVKSIFTFGDSLLVATNDYCYRRRLSISRDTFNLLHVGRTTSAIFSGRLFYVGTLEGLYIYDRSGKPLSRSLDNRISFFAQGPGDTLWVATYNGGVFGYKNGRAFTAITQQRNGLSSNICRCLFLSGRYLWVGTDKGINKIDLAGAGRKVVARYTAADGLTTDIINAIYVAGPMVYAGTSRGLNCFNEGDAPLHGFCNLKLTDIIVSGKNMDIESPLILAHKENNIRFGFSGLSFLSGGKITYRFRLLGLDDSWQTTADQVLSYPSLPSGKYTLQVIAINKFGDKSPVLVRHFEILPSLYERWWFRTAVFVIIALVSLAVVRGWVGRIRKKEAEKRRINRSCMSWSTWLCGRR